MNLVMIGHFKTTRDANIVKQLIDTISAQVSKEDLYETSDSPHSDRRYSDTLRELFSETHIWTVTPQELDQFLSPVHLDVDGCNITLRTDESEVSAFLKVLLEKGAKVEVYSAHDHPESDDTTE